MANPSGVAGYPILRTRRPWVAPRGPPTGVGPHHPHESAVAQRLQPELERVVVVLDNRVAASVQLEMLLDIAGLVEHAAAWLLRGNRLDLGHQIARLGPSIRQLATLLPELLPAQDRAALDERTQRLAAAGVPRPLAATVAGAVFLGAAPEIADLAERAAQPLDRAARVYYGTGARFALDEMRAAARRLPAETAWQKQAVETVIDDLFGSQAEIALRAMQAAADASDPLGAWAKDRVAALAPAEAVAAELRAGAAPDLAMLVVASRQLREALG